MFFHIIVAVVAFAALAFWRLVILAPLQYQPQDMTGRVVLVSGGSAGIGLETVKKFYMWNATVIMPVRNSTKGETVRMRIMTEVAVMDNTVTVGTIDLMDMDLVSFDSVREFAANVLKKYNKIDVVVLNAGIHGLDSITTTVDGIEMAYQVNHLSHFLMARLLLPVTKRFVHVSSMMHFSGVLDTDSYSSEKLNKEEDSARLGMSTYCDTKLMNVVFSNAMDRLLRSSAEYAHVTSVAVHPGYVISDIDRGSSATKEAIMRFLRELFARPSEEGAVAQVAAASQPEILSLGGGLYFEDHCISNGCKSCLICSLHVERGAGVKPHKHALDEAMQDWLWNTSSDIVGLARSLELDYSKM